MEKPVAPTPEGNKKSGAGGKPIDARFRMLVLQALHNLSAKLINFTGWQDGANHRHHQSASEDRIAEPGLQQSPPGDAGTARRGMKAGAARRSRPQTGRRAGKLKATYLR